MGRTPAFGNSGLTANASSAQALTQVVILRHKPVMKIPAWPNLPASNLLAEEIAKNLDSALGSFREVLKRLNKDLQH